MDKSIVPFTDIDIAEELYMIRMAGLKVTTIPEYKELSDKV